MRTNEYMESYAQHSAALDRSDKWKLSDRDLGVLCEWNGVIHRPGTRYPTFSRRKRRASEASVKSKSEIKQQLANQHVEGITANSEFV